nr:hypothetical protein [uncultured Acetatifactor sp.]
MISQSFGFSYRYYKETIDKYINMDPREINFQNRVILPMLEALLTNTGIEVVDASTLYRPSKGIKEEWYRRNGDKAVSPPDLLLVKNWNNTNMGANKVLTGGKEPEFFAAVEIKQPYSEERICGKEMKDYTEGLMRQIEGYLDSERIEKVILTDCFRWQFFMSEKARRDILAGWKEERILGKKIIYSDPIDFVNDKKQWKQGGLLSEDKMTIGEPEEWNMLRENLLYFLNLKGI